MQPKLIDLGVVVDQIELKQLQNTIKSNKHLLSHVSQWIENSHPHDPLNFMGSPIYINRESHNMLYKKLRPLTDSFLKEHASVLLERIKKLLLQRFNREKIEQLPNTSYPGFHVFFSNQTPRIDKYAFHQDSDFLEITLENFDFDKFYSVTTAIEMPKAGGGLGWRTDDNEGFYPYEEGHSYLWKSDIWHKIGDVILDDEADHRITHQMHCIVDTDVIYYYW